VEEAAVVEEAAALAWAAAVAAEPDPAEVTAAAHDRAAATAAP
jgi:hypothetical protein